MHGAHYLVYDVSRVHDACCPMSAQLFSAIPCCLRTKLKELLLMVGRGDMDLDQLETHTYYCKVG